MLRNYLVLGLLCLGGMVGIAHAAPPEEEALARIVIAGETPRTARRLAAADKLADQQKWTEAVDDYQRILSEAGDDLVPLNSRHCVQARRLCHLRLSASPPAALRQYRSRVDVQAQKWLDQATPTRDTALLRRLVDETFCSTPTDRALDLLGDLAFERGNFEEAERWWLLLAVPASEASKPVSPEELIFPDPRVDIAQVRAKQILARLFRGRLSGVPEELKAFELLHPKAHGHLAGRKGNYAGTLRDLAGKPTLLAPLPAEKPWLTFAGDSSRALVLPAPPDRMAQMRPLDGPQWKRRLDTGARVQINESALVPSGKVLPASAVNRSLAFHPIIVGDRLFTADAQFVRGFDLLTGEEKVQYDLLQHVRDEDKPRLRLDLPAEPDLTYTLTADDEHIYARLGAQGLGLPKKEGLGGNNYSFLVCLNLNLHLNVNVERWIVRSKGSAASGPVFEGAPVVGQGRVFIAESRFAAGQTQTSIACYDANTGALRWHRDVCSDTQEFKADDGRQRFRHHLLTLAGSTLFYCSHSGAIVALDTATGHRLWAVRYPSRGAKRDAGAPSPRELAPCLHADGLLYVAPLDYGQILCLDPEFGDVVWESTPVEVIHLLGVAKGRLIFTSSPFMGTRDQPGIRALDAATGRSLRYWCQPADGDYLHTVGRGLLAGDWVFWPTASGLFVLNQEDGEIVFDDLRIRGNLAIGNGCLIVADDKELSVYVPEGRLLGK